MTEAQSKTEGDGTTEEGADKSPSRKSGRRVITASVWVVVARVGQYLFRLGSNFILTRLLLEEAFGIMALVTVFGIGMQMMSDVGVGPSVIQSQRAHDPKFLNTVWSIQIIRGSLIFLACLIGAQPFASFYEEPILAQLIPVIGLGTFIRECSSTKFWEASRRLETRQIAMVEFSGALVSAFTMIVFALIHPSVWALVVGNVAGAVTHFLMCQFYLTGHTSRLGWDSEAAQSIFTFGRWVFGSTILTFLVTQTDRLVFGKMIPMQMLGVYHIGAMLTTFAPSMLRMFADKILFPLSAQMREKGVDLQGVYRQGKIFNNTVAGWMLCGFIAGGQVIVDILFDDRYAQAGWIVQILSFAAWVGIMPLAARPVLLAKGNSRAFFLANLGKLIVMAIAMPLGFHLFGFPGGVCGFALSELGAYTVISGAVYRAGLGSSWGDLLVTGFLLGVAFVANAAARAVASAGGGAIASAIVIFIVVTVAWSPRFWTMYGTVKRLRNREL